MTIQILGGGSVGLLIASFLIEKGFAVEIVAKRAEQREALHAYGLVRQGAAGEREAFKTGASANIAQHPALLIVATKYDALAGLYPEIAKLPASVPLLFVQNGLAHYQEAMRLPQRHIAFGSAQFGAQRAEDHLVIHRGIGVLKLAVARGNVEEFAAVAALDSKAFPVRCEEEAEKMLLEKALLNCFINPLTAILQVKNGELLTNGHAYSLLEALYGELMEAFPDMRTQFPFDGVKELCERTAANTSSMLADRLAGRKMEIDTIAGAIIEKAEDNGRQLPTLRTLYGIIKALEQVEGDES